MIYIEIYNKIKKNTFEREYKDIEKAKKFLERIKPKDNLEVVTLECDPSIRKDLTNLL